jgi:acetyl esterase
MRRSVALAALITVVILIVFYFGIRRRQAPQLDPAARAFVDSLPGQLPDMSPAEARQVLEKIQMRKEPAAVNVQEATLSTQYGPVPVHVVKPLNSPEGKLLPGVIYAHGGGWILGSYATHSRPVSELALRIPAAVVFVDYTRAPEARFPTQIYQILGAARYIAQSGASFGIDGSRLIIAGDSVGGNMAAAVTFLAKKQGPKFLGQILMYPVTDCNFRTPSYRKFAKGPWLTKRAMQWFWDAYCPDKRQRTSYLASPLRAPTELLQGLPPALGIVDANDVLLSESEAYFGRLNRAGVPIAAARYQFMIHDFLMLNPLSDTPSVRSAMDSIVEFARRLFGAAPP